MVLLSVYGENTTIYLRCNLITDHLRFTLQAIQEASISASFILLQSKGIFNNS